MKVINFIALIVCLCSSTVFCKPKITIAILAKDKAHVLPLYLQCIEEQTWPKEDTNLYIRTNNNNDNTVEVLKNWLKKVHKKYNKIFLDDSDVGEPVQQYGQHEWNTQRFNVLGAIRQASVDWAYEQESHYFVCDCDNFIVPETVEALYRVNLPIVAPLLYSTDGYYSNYHADIDENGYYKRSPFYFPLLNRELKGLVEVPVVHCVYFIRRQILPSIAYSDDTYRHEYVIFSHNAREKGIPQYLDTRKVYGRLSWAENYEELLREPWIGEFSLP